MTIKVFLRKHIGLIGWGLALLLLIIVLGSGSRKDNKIIESESQQNQASLSQNIQNDLDQTQENDSNNSNIENENNLTSKPNEQTKETTEKQELFFKVAKVVDGDTITLENSEVVRYIGIDTPETVHPSKPVQCFGKEASDKNKELVEGKIIKVEKDITNRDKYDRLLYYVWVGDLFVNDYLVRQGYAYAYTYPPDVKYSGQFVQAQQEARDNNRGLWAGCAEKEVFEKTPLPSATPAVSITPSPTPTPAPAPAPMPTQEIICSSNAYNCSDFSTHAEAQNVFNYCGGIGNDIHRLDSDKDGSACESLP